MKGINAPQSSIGDVGCHRHVDGPLFSPAHRSNNHSQMDKWDKREDRCAIITSCHQQIATPSLYVTDMYKSAFFFK